MAQGIRIRERAIEAKCDYCLEWWPLVAEDGSIDEQFWMPSLGLRRCLACYRDQRAAYLRSRREDPVLRERDRAASDANRAAKNAVDPDHAKRVQHEWYVRNAESERANRRARYAAQKALAGKTMRRSPGPTEELIAEARRLRERKRKTDWQRVERATKAAEARAA